MYINQESLKGADNIFNFCQSNVYSDFVYQITTTLTLINQVIQA